MKLLNRVRHELEVLEGRWAASTLLDCAATELGSRATAGEELAATAQVAATAKSARAAARGAANQAEGDTLFSAKPTAHTANTAQATARLAVTAALREIFNSTANSAGEKHALTATRWIVSADSDHAFSMGLSTAAPASRDILVTLPELPRTPGVRLSHVSLVADWTGSGGASIPGSSSSSFSANVTLGSPGIAPAVIHQPANTVADDSVPFVPEINSGGDKATAAAKPGGGSTVSKTYWVLGDPADAAVTPTSSGLALVGGSTDVDEVFTWMGAKANGGDFLVLRASGTDAYNPYILELSPNLNSVATLLIGSRKEAMNNAALVSVIEQAEAIFLAGGDQSNYENYWANTPVETAIYSALARGVPIGGTSAGLAVLGEVDYTALNGSVTSENALANPLDRRITLSTQFLPAPSQTSILNLLDNVVTDSHFEQRDRMGRLLTFMARADNDIAVVNAAPRGLGINEQTALLVEPDGTATVAGNLNAGVTQAVYLLDSTATSVPLIAAKTPLTYVDVNVVRATVGQSFNINTVWSSVALANYQLDVNNGVVASTATTIYG